MAQKYEIGKEYLERLQRARKSNRNKNVDRRLHALILHAEGYTGKKVSEITDTMRSICLPSTKSMRRRVLMG